MAEAPGVSCSRCGAKPGELCRTAGGHTTGAHAIRLGRKGAQRGRHRLLSDAMDLARKWRESSRFFQTRAKQLEQENRALHALVDDLRKEVIATEKRWR